MTPQDERIAAFIRNRFKKSGASVADTGLLEEISVEARTFVESSVLLEDGEALLVASVPSSTCLSALTTRRLLVVTDSGLQSVPWEDINEVVVEFASIGYLPDAQSKLSEAKVINDAGAEVWVKTSPGQSFIGFWNCLLLAKQMGKEEARRRKSSQE